MAGFFAQRIDALSAAIVHPALMAAIIGGESQDKLRYF